MKILLIGGTGNISSACAALLRKQDHDVVLLTRGRSEVPKGGFRVLQADRNQREEMLHALRKLEPQVVINFLGYKVAQVKLDQLLFQNRVRQYIFISSATVYAKPPPVLPITEDTPLGNPWWDYAQDKLQCESWLLARWKEERFPVTIVRPSHTYSERWIPNAISSSSYTFAARLEQGRAVYVHDQGNTPWTLTTSHDFAVGLAGLVGNSAAIGEAYHITSYDILTWNRIYAEIARALGVRSPIIEKIPTDFICQVAPRFTGTLKGDKAHPGVFDNTKIKQLVPGFKTTEFLSDGLARSVEFLRKHPEHQNRNAELDELIELIIQKWKTERRRWRARRDPQASGAKDQVARSTS